MKRILFVCHGNICRSAMAEFIFKDMVHRYSLDDDFYIESAATSREEIGNPVYPPAKTELERHGISCKGKRARQITREDYDRFDYILCAETFNIRNTVRITGPDRDKKIFRILDFSDRPRDIADPWYYGNFDRTYDDITEGMEAFLRKMYPGLTAPDRGK